MPSSHSQKRIGKVVAWTIAAIIAYSIIILGLSLIDDPEGEPWLESSLLGQLVVTFGAVLSVFGPVIFQNARSTAAVREQVENDHRKPNGEPINLRDDIDEIKCLVEDGFKRLNRDIGGLRQENRDDRRDVVEDRAYMRELDRRIRNIERS